MGEENKVVGEGEKKKEESVGATAVVGDGEEEKNKKMKKSKKQGLISRIWKGIFRRRSDDFEKRLQYISKEEAAVMARVNRSNRSWQRTSRQIIIIFVIFEDDESLRRWKEQLLGNVYVNNVTEVLEPEVKIISLSIVSPGREDIVLPIPENGNPKGLWTENQDAIDAAIIGALCRDRRKQVYLGRALFFRGVAPNTGELPCTNVVDGNHAWGSFSGKKLPNSSSNLSDQLIDPLFLFFFTLQVGIEMQRKAALPLRDAKSGNANKMRALCSKEALVKLL
ncbi:hypothetical protein AHAS_Ahas14G0118500 [Arachis hypogaea]